MSQPRYRVFRSVMGLALGAALALASRADAQVAQFRHDVFITSTVHTIDDSCEASPDGVCFGGHVSADYIVTFKMWQAGVLPGWNGFDVIYKALVSTAPESAKQHAEIRGPVYNLGGALLATDADDFWDGTILTGINFNEYSNLVLCHA